MSEKEFFAARAPEISGAGTSAARKRMIGDLATEQPKLYAEYRFELRRGEVETQLIRGGRFPLCAVGKINTYSIFAEHFRALLSPSGLCGIITPTGLATDATTAAFFADTVRSQRLAAFYDFENEAKIFAGVHNQFRFAVTSISGGRPVSELQLAFYTRYVSDVPRRRFSLSAEEVLLLNPNTGTLPVFRSRRDAEISLSCYRSHPVLVRHGAPDGSPWGLRFKQGLFNMASDSESFVTADQLADHGAVFDGWGWDRGDDRWLPLFEGKLLGHWNHRYSTFKGATQAQLNKGTLPRIGDAALDDPAVEPLARYWVEQQVAEDAVGQNWRHEWLLGLRRLTRASDQRTLIPSVIPRSAVGDNTWVAQGYAADWQNLQVALSSPIADYLVRQKLSGSTLSGYILEQIACPHPAAFSQPVQWLGTSVDVFVRPRVLELAYTSDRLIDYAVYVTGESPGRPFRWVPERRAVLRAELDAAMFHLYGLARDASEHVLDSFFVVRRNEERHHGEFRTKRLVLEAYDAMATAAATGQPYTSPLDPPAGAGPRHQGVDA